MLTARVPGIWVLIEGSGFQVFLFRVGFLSRHASAQVDTHHHIPESESLVIRLQRAVAALKKPRGAKEREDLVPFLIHHFARLVSRCYHYIFIFSLFYISREDVVARLVHHFARPEP
jgi:hypothetical protein